MWNNYFYNLQIKYSMRLSYKEPLVIRFDGKGITKSSEINLIDTSSNSFNASLEKTVRYFTEKYECYSLFGSDEVSFIIDNPKKLMADLSSECTNHSNEVISLFSQYFFHYFNQFDAHRLIFWHAKCFSIPEGKKISYVKYRLSVIENVMTSYFLKRKGIVNSGNIPLKDRLAMCKKYEDYSTISNIKRGTLFYNGHKIDIGEFLNGKIVVLDKVDDPIFDDILDS